MNTTPTAAREEEKEKGRATETELKYQPSDEAIILRREGKDIRIGGISI